MEYYSDEKIKIRDIRLSDINHLFRWWIDPEVYKYDPKPIPNNTQSLLKEVEWFCKRFDNEIMNEDYSKRRYDYFIITNKDDAPIGFVNFFNKKNSKLLSEGEMGIILGEKNYHNQGIGTLSISIVTDYLFNKMNIGRIYIETLETNSSTIHIFEKLNFKKCSMYKEGELTFIIMEKYKI